MLKNTIKKQQVLVKTWIVKSFVAFSQLVPKCFFCDLILSGSFRFAVFHFICGTNLYFNSLQKRVPEEATSHVNARNFYTRCSTLPKHPLISDLAHLLLYQTCPEHLPEKVWNKTRPGFPPERFYRSCSYIIRMCVIWKNKTPNLNSHRNWQQERVPERPAPTR